MLKKCFEAEGSKIYKHIYHGIGLTHNGGEVRFFCGRGMKGPYSDKSDETIEYLTSIVSDLVCRDIAFTYYPPDYIKNGKIYDKNFIAPWWAIEPNSVCARRPLASTEAASRLRRPLASTEAASRLRRPVVQITIENANPYYVTGSMPVGQDTAELPSFASVDTSHFALVRKRYLDYIPCLEFEDQPIFCAANGSIRTIH